MIRDNTMRRWLSVLLCAILGLLMLVCGLLVPVHLRAVDAYVIQDAGRRTRAWCGKALSWPGEQPGRRAVALAGGVPSGAVARPGTTRPGGYEFGCAAPGWMVLGSPNVWPRAARGALGRAVRWCRRAGWGGCSRRRPGPRAVRRVAGAQGGAGAGPQVIEASAEPAIRELLRCRALTNTVIFPPSSSASGQVFDTAVAACGLLYDKKLHPDLSNAVYDLAWTANHGGRAPPGREEGRVRAFRRYRISRRGPAGPDVPWPAVQLGPTSRFVPAESRMPPRCTRWPTWFARPRRGKCRCFTPPSCFRASRGKSPGTDEV